jgi:GT2 family glycosyltransferase
MRGSVIVRSCNEADRLRLTLASLAGQTEPAEVIVVDDGSTDHTAAVIAEAAATLPILAVRHAVPLGRSLAANAGAARASGDVLIFLDGDTLAAPDFVRHHLHRHRAASGVVARGDTRHLRGTRFLADPESGAPQPGQEARLARMGEAELARLRVTRADIAGRFDTIDARARPGIYPGAGPGLLHEMEMTALRDDPGCGVLWAAASGANLSVDRHAFLDVGGFDGALTNNEHRELALRLCRAGLRMVPAEARTCHMTHRSGWRDPLTDTSWETIFYRAHPIPAVALLAVLWASLSDRPPFPRSCRITSLAGLARAADRCRGVLGIEAVRAAHFLATAEAA